MQVGVLTLFPDMFSALSENGISGRAVDRGIVSIETYNPRDFTVDRHRSVDDRPYGGGPGMVMTAEPLSKALQHARDDIGQAKVVSLSPQGRRLDQEKVVELANEQRVVLICGRYEGIDERFIEAEVDEEISLGDYVISGGELAAMVVLDAVIRQLPGALGDAESAEQDSFSRLGLLDCPHYSRPEQWRDREVPSVLLSGDHERIRQWRLQQALLRTRERRPDLFAQLELTDDERALLTAVER